MDLKDLVALDPRLVVPDPVSASGESGEEMQPPSAQIARDSDSECSDADCHMLTRHKNSSHLPDIEYSSDESNEALANDLYAELEPDSDLDRQQRDEEY